VHGGVQIRLIPREGPGRETAGVRALEPVVLAPPEVDEARMGRDRLRRTQQLLREHQLAAVLLCDPLNVRYATVGGPFPVFNLHNTFRWALVPAESPPVLWEYPQSLPATAARWDGDVRPATGWTFFGSGSRDVAAAARFAGEVVAELEERGLAGEPVGVDRLETGGHVALARAGVRVVDAQPAMERARAVKTCDELTALRANARVCDQGIEELRRLLRPGVSENELWAALVGFAFSRGAEWCETRLLSSGPRTNPWMQEATGRLVRDGDLVAFDTDLVGRHGYLTDVSRTYLCGDRRPRDEQRRLHQVAHDFLHTCLPEIRPGRSFEELGRRLGPLLPEEFQAQRYPFIAHGTGLVDEYPCVNFVDHHEGELEVGMVLSVESYVGALGGAEGVKLEEQVVVTPDGPELLSAAPYEERLLS
jgi:Xaa-Pro aminopeptidase